MTVTVEQLTEVFAPIATFCVVSILSLGLFGMGIKKLFQLIKGG